MGFLYLFRSSFWLVKPKRTPIIFVDCQKRSRRWGLSLSLNSRAQFGTKIENIEYCILPTGLLFGEQKVYPQASWTICLFPKKQLLGLFALKHKPPSHFRSSRLVGASVAAIPWQTNHRAISAETKTRGPSFPLPRGSWGFQCKTPFDTLEVVVGLKTGVERSE